MAEDNQNTEAGAAGAEEQAEQRMVIQHVYLKDASFEAPNVLELNQSDGTPDIDLNMAQRTNKLDDERFEVLLAITVTSRQGEKTAFLCEVQYGGVFELSGFSEQQMHYVVNVLCPNVLFPYCRTQIGSLIGAGGFYLPPLQPINFEAIYQQRMAEAASQQSGGNGQEAPAGEH